jgi:phosphoenolpyruvate carboxylase
MEYIPLVLEGLEHKVKKVIFKNQQLEVLNKKIAEKNKNLENEILAQQAKISELEETIIKLKVSKVLTGHDTMQARQQINELLREIDKCYSLLNR